MAIRIVVGGSPEDLAVIEYAFSTTMPDAAIELGRDGFRVLELVRRGRPHVVVLDPAVSSISGPQLVARMREETPASPVVCWTSAPDVDEAADLFLAGAAGYLLKEDGPADLIARISTVLEGGFVIAPRVAIPSAAGEDPPVRY